MESLTKAVIYARVSTVEQAQEGFSIESQLKLLRDYAREQGISVQREFVDHESAKQAGRTNFNEMLRFMKVNSSVQTVLVEKTDRLYRNFSDYVLLDVDRSELTVVLVKEGVVLNKNCRSHEKLVHGLKILLAKNFLDNLREETSKGLLEKAEQGEFPQNAPLGYINNKETHLIDVDQQRAPLIRRMFELYASGEYSIETLKVKITEEGLRSKGGRKLQKSEVHNLLRNSLFAGSFLWRGKLYKGVHQPIITKELFEVVQTVMKRFNKPRITRLEFPFRGLMTCGKCGCSFTAERKKGRYIYYHCTYGKGPCKNKLYRQEEVDRRLEGIIKDIRIDREVLNLLTDGLKQSHVDEKTYHDQAITSLNQTYQKLQNKLDRAYEDRLEDVITTEFWERQSQFWRKEQQEVRESIARHESANQSYFDLGIQLLELAHEAHDLYRVRSLPEKRQLVNFVVSNLMVDGENITPSYRKPFDLLVNAGDRPNWLPVLDEIRNWTLFGT